MRAGARLTHPGSGQPGDVWSSFHATCWERRATVLRQPFAEPVTTPTKLWRALVDVADRHRAHDPSVRVELYIEHALLLADVGRHLPDARDGSIDGWAHRLTTLIGGRTFGLVVTDIQAYEPELWLRLRDALRGLFALTGLPAATKSTLFLGNYPATPFGLHRGNSGTLAFAIDGPKRIRAWPDAYFQGRDDPTYRLDYAEHDAGSVVLDAAPGDVIYWPSDHWHIGEAVDGALSAAVSVAMFMELDEADELLVAARGLLRRRLREGGRDHGDDDADRRAAALRDVGADPALAAALRLAALRHATALGFDRPPPPLPPRALGDDELVRGSAEDPIRWIDTDGGRIAVSANGHAFGLTASPMVVALLERLNGGEPHRVRDLVAAHAGVARVGDRVVEASPASVRAVLEKLASLRAIGRA